MGTAKIQGELWGERPHDWAMIQEPPSKPLWEAMLDGALVGAGSHILDVGCGAGGATALAAARGATVSGLDAAKGLIAFARQRLPEGDFRVGEMERLPYDDEQFDAVFAANSLQFSGNHMATVREFARVCRPQGRIVVGLFGLPAQVELATILKSVAMLMPTPPTEGGPFVLSVPGKLAGLFEEAGLNVIADGEVDCPFAYPDFDTLWRGAFSSGPMQAVLRVVDAKTIKSTLKKAAEPFRLDSGGYLIQPNIFQYVVATR
jgi:SAM-dependent methyltransferase